MQGLTVRLGIVRMEVELLSEYWVQISLIAITQHLPASINLPWTTPGWGLPGPPART